MKLGVDAGSARRAKRDYRLAKQEVEHRSDATRQSQADNDPHARAHRTTRRITAYVAGHQHVECRQRAPGEREIKAQAKGSCGGLEPMRGQNHPEKILHENERESGGGDRPPRNEGDFFSEGRSALRVVCRADHLSIEWTEGFKATPVVLHILLTLP